MVITGTPLENKLLDLYSIVQFLDQQFLAPQWEFSYQHCIFDTKSKNKIRGYYNLRELKKRLETILIRREKKEVFSQLPNVIQQNIYIKLSTEQAELHASFARGVAAILGKKFKTSYDWQRLMLLLNNMRMACDSSYLIDKKTHFSPKLVELQDILMNKLEVKKSNRKIIIFSEWVTMLNLIGDMLKKEGLTYTMLTGKVPVKKRGALIKEFEENPDCNIFLSTESGGSGLNLQVADTVINFELPWNPAKKNQRIGRIDRIGQQKQKLHVFNLVSYDSIEMKISAGLFLKQNLFDGVLNSNCSTDEVDFSSKGKSQFIKQLEEMFGEDDYNGQLEIEDLIFENDEENELFEVLNEGSEGGKEGVENERGPEKSVLAKEAAQKNATPKESALAFTQMEKVMHDGMNFLSGMMKMATGSDLGFSDESIQIDKETGEVTMKFKLPNKA